MSATRVSASAGDPLLGGVAENEQAALREALETVDHHVSAVLSKLGAPSRTVAASEAVRLGLINAHEVG